MVSKHALLSVLRPDYFSKNKKILQNFELLVHALRKEKWRLKCNILGISDSILKGLILLIRKETPVKIITDIFKAENMYKHFPFL